MILTGAALEAVSSYALSPSCEPDRASVDVHAAKETVVEPHSYAVVDSAERVTMPENTAATITGRSSHMRAGVTMPGGFVDPGYEDNFVLEFFNHSDQEFRIREDEPAGRLTFLQLSARPDAAARFWSKVDVRQGDQCWEWLRSTNSSGYGQFRYEGEIRPTHQVAYVLYYHEPGDMHVLHNCNNRKCVNPHHLYLGTNQDNVDDTVEAGSFFWNGKLTEEEVSEIRARYNEEEIKQEELAEEYGVTQSNISRAINRRRYDND